MPAQLYLVHAFRATTGVAHSVGVRLNEVVRADGPRQLTWGTMRAWPFPDSAEWSLTLSEQGAGTRVEESFCVLHMPHIMGWLVPLVVPSHRDRGADLRMDLERLRAIVEAGT